MGFYRIIIIQIGTFFSILGSMCSINIVIIIVTVIISIHWQTVSLVNTLESTPPSVNGVLTACAGQQISLTCSHNSEISIASVTIWRASPPVNCTSVAIHINSVGLVCGPFRFDRITRVELDGPYPLSFNSTAMANVTVNMTGTNIECIGGNIAPRSVGNISLCIVGEFHRDDNNIINLTCVPSVLIITISTFRSTSYT